MSNFCSNNIGGPIIDLQPRPFDQLLAERTYLLGALQKENEKAAMFLRRVQPLEDIISTTSIPQLRRSYKRQLGWIKSRFKETACQEKCILNRLGDLSYEIQSQERVNRIYFENFEFSRPEENHFPHQGMGRFVLNPSTPPFHPPQGCILPTTSRPQQDPNFYASGPLSETQLPQNFVSGTTGMPYFEKGFPFPSQTLDESASVVRSDMLERPEILHRSSSLSSPRVESDASTQFGASQQSRRCSLPSVFLDGDDSPTMSNDDEASEAFPGNGEAHTSKEREHAPSS